MIASDHAELYTSDFYHNFMFGYRWWVNISMHVQGYTTVCSPFMPWSLAFCEGKSLPSRHTHTTPTTTTTTTKPTQMLTRFLCKCVQTLMHTWWG